MEVYYAVVHSKEVHYTGVHSMEVHYTVVHSMEVHYTVVQSMVCTQDWAPHGCAGPEAEDLSRQPSSLVDGFENFDDNGSDSGLSGKSPRTSKDQ